MDAFPLDPAASVDTDGDLYPDVWNNGYSESNSTQGLTLDYFPVDEACNSINHSRNGTCDIALKIPNYTPTQIAFDGKVIYYLSRENHKVFRWSMEENYHLEPIGVNFDPLDFTYSKDDKSLYIIYEEPYVSKLSISDNLKETHFVNHSGRTKRISSVGKNIILYDAGYVEGTNYIYAFDGSLKSTQIDRINTSNYATNEMNNRLYYLKRGRFPLKLTYDVIDQTTQNVSETKCAEYLSSTNREVELIVSLDGSRVFLGLGQIYDGNTLSLLHNMGHGITTGAWASNRLVTLRQESESTKVEFFDDSYVSQSSFSILGSPIKIFPDEQGLVLKVNVNGQPTVHTCHSESRLCANN